MKNFEITKEQVYEVAKRYGLKVTEGDESGLKVNGKEISVEDLLKDWNVEE